MTIEECYRLMRADYESVLLRMGKEDLVLRFLRLFLDEGSYAAMQTAITENNPRAAYQAAHSLKGVCLNLGLTALFQSSSDLAEELRGGAMTPAAASLFDQVTQDYQTAVQSIEQLVKL